MRKTEVSLAVVLSLLLAGSTEAQKQSPSSEPTPVLSPVDTMPPIKYSPAEGEVSSPDGLPQWLGDWKRFKTDLEQRYGTKVGLVLDDHYQHIAQGPGEGEGDNVFWWNLSIDQRLWKGGTLRFKARGSDPHDDPPVGITPLVGTKLNLDWAAYETSAAYIANLYLEQKFSDDKLTVAIGKITFPNYFDENKVAGWDFFSHALARNQLFPHRYHTIGALLRYDPTDWLYLQLGTTDARGIRSETGLNTMFDGDTELITMGEVGIKTDGFAGRQGNYRFDVWHDSRHIARHDGNGTESGMIGFGVSFDQMITKSVGAFFRYGVEDGDVRTFGQFWSLGGTWKGPFSPRRDDVLGFGMAQGLTDRSYRLAKNGTPTETLLETYYKLRLSDYMSLTFDCQVLFDPGANPSNETAIIPGLRLKISL